jgi:diguanylate cyclase (GGDEF)-like protein
MGTEKRGAATDPHLGIAIEQSPLATALLGPDGRYLLVNAAWNALWSMGVGGPPEGSNAFEDERLRAVGLISYLEECRADGAVSTSPLSLETRGAETGPRWLKALVYPVRDEAGSLLQMGLVIEDFTERKALEDQLAHRAFHDPLTGLPNRALFSDRLVHALARAKRRAERGEPAGVAVLYMDLDEFKRFNDSLGHHAGDRLLVGVAERVAARMRAGDTFARIAGDEFGLLLEGLEDVGQAAETAERIKRELTLPFLVDGHEAVVTASIGIAAADPGGSGEEHAEELMRRADVAMYQGKREGKDRHKVFSSRMNHSFERLELEENLRRAIAREELRVYYQPQVGVSTGQVVGFEALVRWEYPERGLLLPSEFIPVAEQTGMIVPLGRWVLAEACRQARTFREQVPPDAPLRIGVNLSALQLRHPELVREVAEALSESGMDPRGLALEITESVMTEEDRPNAVDTLRGLKNLGVSLAIDDFGTGHSSIANLKSFPVDIIKMDRSMVEGVDEDPKNRAIVSATRVLARAFGLEVGAEGVETAEEMEELRLLGCDFAQGYYWREPGPAEEMEKLLTGGLGS